ncbi:hypothetical protein ACFQH9_01825 [Pseudonocardia lutea]|uniref:Uncharacterized protein n=1 Tax=Pseudonocardia lutea TaxID=2172015 RepID=A0ABW1I3Y6_9PSEU
MGIAALIAWVLTAVGGAVLLGRWVAHGGLRSTGAGHFPPGLVLGHFALAAAGLVVWIVHLLLGSTLLAWISLALLVVVALLGFGMFRLWVPGYRARTATTAGSSAAGSSGAGSPGAGSSGAGSSGAGGEPGAASGVSTAPARETAEAHLPPAVVAAHGVLGVATVVLVLLATLGVAAG